MALAWANTAILESALQSAFFKISETQIVAVEGDYAKNRVVEFVGGSITSHTSTDDDFNYIITQYCYKSLPFSNQIVYVGQDNLQGVGDPELHLVLTEFDTSNIGNWSHLSSVQINDQFPGSGFNWFDITAIAMTSATEGYAIVETTSATTWYLVEFSISGSTISLDDVTELSSINPSVASPSAAIGLYNGSALQFWVNSDGELYYDIVTQGSIGSPVHSWVPGDAEAIGGFSGNYRVNIQADFNTSNMFTFASPSVKRWNRLVRYSPTVLAGTPESDSSTYPPESEAITDASILTLGTNSGVFAWHQGLNESNVYIAECAPDISTGNLNVNQATRITAGTVSSCLAFFPMVNGTEAALVHQEEVGASSISVKQITGLPGYVVPPPGDTGKRLWVYKGNGIDWSSRGLKTA